MKFSNIPATLSEERVYSQKRVGAFDREGNALSLRLSIPVDQSSERIGPELRKTRERMRARMEALSRSRDERDSGEE